jgi:hypothetical protein
MPLIKEVKTLPILRTLFLSLPFILCLIFAQPCRADNIGLITRGLAKTLFSVFEIPRDMVMNSGTAFPLGLVGGAVRGSMKAVVGTIAGVGDIARGAAPYAKYAVFAL